MDTKFSQIEMLETRINDRITAIEANILTLIRNLSISQSRIDEEIRDIKKTVNDHIQHYQKVNRECLISDLENK